MRRIREIYWTIRLKGYRVDPAKNIVQSKGLYFRVAGTLNRQPEYRKDRLNFVTNEYERVEKIYIG